MSLTLTTTCDFCGAAEQSRNASIPLGWARLNVAYNEALAGILHACPSCQNPNQARNLWPNVDRVIALDAGMPGAMPVPMVVLPAEDTWPSIPAATPQGSPDPNPKPE